MDLKLSFREHIGKKTELGNSMVAITTVWKSFLSLSRGILTTLHNAFVRSNLEYTNQAWNPYLKKDKVIN